MPEQDSDRRSVDRFRRIATWLVALAALGLVVGLVAFRRGGRGPSAERFAYQAKPEGELPKLWDLPPFDFSDQRNAPVSRESLRGKPFIADFIFTQCTNACPMLTSRMVHLQRRLVGRDVRFVSFSVDPAHDDAAALTSYAQRWNPSESRWALVVTDDKRLPDLVNAFRVTAENTNDTDNPIIHSNVFFLVDGESSVRAVYASDDPAALDRLVRDAERLAGNPTEGHAAEGRTYLSLGCAGCHENPKVAPPLVNLMAAQRMLESGDTVTVDRGYMKRAILEPGVDLVRGYLPLMPSYRKDLTDAQVEALVDELLERKGAVKASEGAVDIGVDPVCHMRVRAEPSAPHAEHEGRTVHFCSESCREAFVASPARYPVK